MFNKVSEKQAELRKKEEVEKKKLKEKKPIIGKLEPGGAPARPPLSKLLNIQVPLGPPSKKIKKEDENDDEDMRTDGEDVIAIDTDTDAVQVISEAEVKTEAESDWFLLLTLFNIVEFLMNLFWKYFRVFSSMNVLIGVILLGIFLLYVVKCFLVEKWLTTLKKFLHGGSMGVPNKREQYLRNENRDDLFAFH